MSDITLLQAIDSIAHICLMFTVLNAILPPYDILKDFPNAQKYYKLILAIVKYFSGDVRRRIMDLYPSFKEKALLEKGLLEKLQNGKEDANKK